MSEPRINVRVQKELKESAEMLFDKLGLNMTTAISVFLRKAVDEQAIPFVVGTKSTSFAGELTSSDITRNFKSSVDSEIANIKRLDAPVARYDKASKQAYLEYPDGRKEYFEHG